MKVISRTLATMALSLTLAQTSSAADIQANNCQIFIKKIGVSPSSHGANSLAAVVKVNWLGNGEMIERVGFWAQSSSQDLGNTNGCFFPNYTNPTFRVIDPIPYNYPTLSLGEYYFSFPVTSGSVVSNCRGFNYSWNGAFFVQTNQNTYWVNPSLDSAQNFVFDYNGYDILTRQVGYSSLASTARGDLGYYNPAQCR